MKKLILAGVGWAALCAGCSGCIPLDSMGMSPSPTYTCLTQQRTYINPVTNESWLEVDHYTQATPCPKVRVK